MEAFEGVEARPDADEQTQLRAREDITEWQREVKKGERAEKANPPTLASDRIFTVDDNFGEGGDGEAMRPCKF